MDKAAQYLGIMRKAGALAIGETESGAALKSGKACVLCLAADASDNARKRGESFVFSRRIPLIRLPYEKAALQQIFGKPGCSMFGILDYGFASAFVGALAAADPEQYGSAHASIQARAAEQPLVGKGKNGKRRNRV